MKTHVLFNIVLSVIVGVYGCKESAPHQADYNVSSKILKKGIPASLVLHTWETPAQYDVVLKSVLKNQAGLLMMDMTVKGGGTDNPRF